MSLGLRTSRLAVAALLLAATAGGAGTAHAADPVTNTTTLLVQVPAILGQLTLSTTSSSVTPTATRQADGTVLVTADLPDVAVSDSRSNKPGWSYSVSMPATLRSATDSTVAVQASGTEVQVPSLPVISGVVSTATGLSRKNGWQPFVTGKVADLVTAGSNAVTANTSFTPQLRFHLPADTAAGEYRAVVTHSVV